MLGKMQMNYSAGQAELQTSLQPQEFNKNNNQKSNVLKDMQNNQSAKNIIQKSASRDSKFSYMYKQPQLTAQQKCELQKFLIVQEKQKERQITSNCQLFCNSFAQMNLSTWYMIGLSFTEVLLFLFYAIWLSTTQQPLLRRIGLAVLMGLSGIIYAIGMYYLCWKKQCIDKFWAYIWIFSCFVLIGGATSIWYVALTISLASCLALTIILLFERKGWFTYLIILFMIFQFPVTAIIIAFAFSIQINHNFGAAAGFICLFAATLIGIAYDLCKVRWVIKTKHQKWHLVCLCYLSCILLVVFLSIGISGDVTWIYLSQIINVCYIIDLIYYFLNVVQIKCQGKKFILIQKLQKCWSRQETNTNLMYQMGDSLLTTNSHYLKNPRKSIIGKPLAQCIVCLNEQSRFFYQSCHHICVGHYCILDWLKKNVKRCPICRETSQVIVQIKRIRDMEFQILNKYRFKKLQ